MNKTKTAIIAVAGFYWLYRWITYQIFMAFIVLAHRRGGELGALYFIKPRAQGKIAPSFLFIRAFDPLPSCPRKTLEHLRNTLEFGWNYVFTREQHRCEGGAQCGHLSRDSCVVIGWNVMSISWDLVMSSQL